MFRPEGNPVQEGDLPQPPDLAYTFKIIADQRADAFYTGALAGAIVDTQLNKRMVFNAGNRARLVGRMTLADLAN